MGGFNSLYIETKNWAFLNRSLEHPGPLLLHPDQLQPMSSKKGKKENLFFCLSFHPKLFVPFFGFGCNRSKNVDFFAAGTFREKEIRIKIFLLSDEWFCFWGKVRRKTTKVNEVERKAPYKLLTIYVLVDECPAHTYTQTHVHPCTHTHMRTHPHTCTHTRTHPHTCTHTHTHAHTRTHTHPCAHAYKYTCKYVIVNTYKYMPASITSCIHLLKHKWMHT